VSASEEDDHDLPPPLNLPTFKPVVHAHEILQAVEAIGHNLDDLGKFIRQVQSIDYGLNAEVEFSTLLAWLGNCEMVHRLGQEVMPSDVNRKWNVPDLFALFRRGTDRFSAMIEVKTTKGTILTFKPWYIENLLRYCSLHSQRLLIAWRPRNVALWFLVSPEHLRPVGDTLQLDLEVAWKNSLMGCLAGDFSIHRYEGAGLYVEMGRDSEKLATDNGYEARYVIQKVEWRDGRGNAYEKLPLSITSALLTKAIDHETVEDPIITKAWVCDGSFVYAQEVLRTVVTFWSQDEGPIRWNHVYENFDGILSRARLDDGLQKYFGVFVHILVHQILATWPVFLSESWRVFGE
jgi:Holliday junction resolvase